MRLPTPNVTAMARPPDLARAAVASGQPWGDPVAGLAVTAFICHVGYQVTSDVVHRLADGIDPGLPAPDADALGRQVADSIALQLPDAGSLTWASRAAPA